MKTIRLVVWISMLTLFAGCGDCRQSMKHFHSSLTGLHRTVKLYDANGCVIKKWTGTFQVEDTGGSITFVTDDGLSVKLAGTYTVEEN